MCCPTLQKFEIFGRGLYPVSCEPTLSVQTVTRHQFLTLKGMACPYSPHVSHHGHIIRSESPRSHPHVSHIDHISQTCHNPGLDTVQLVSHQSSLCQFWQQMVETAQVMRKADKARAVAHVDLGLHVT